MSKVKWCAQALSNFKQKMDFLNWELMTNLFSRASRSITITARQPFTFDINSESPFVTVTGFTLGKRRDWVPRVQVLITISHMDIIRVIRATPVLRKAMLSNQSWI